MKGTDVTMTASLIARRIIRCLPAAVVALISAAILAALPASPARAGDPQLDWYGPYELWTTQNEYVLSVAEAGGSGARVVLWDELGSGEQWWWFEDAPGGGLFLHPTHNIGLCLDGTAIGGSALGVKTCDGSNAQNFTVTVTPGTSHYAIKPLSASNLCADAGNLNRGDVPVLKACDNGTAQQFDYAEDV